MKWRALAFVSLLVAVVMGANTVQALVDTLQDKKGTVKVVQDDALVATTSTSFVDLSGFTTTVATKANGLLVLRFASQAFCTDGAANGCSGFVQILVDNVAVPPNGGGAVYLNQDGTFGALSLGIDRAVDGLGAGSHTVKVQWKSSTSDQFSMLNSQLTVSSFKG